MLGGGNPPPSGAYKFTLCPNTNFGVTEPLVPALDGIEIGCGDPPLVQNNCNLEGGDVQVDVQGFERSTFPVSLVTMQGISFSSFSDAAVAGSATDATEVVISSTSFEVSSKLEQSPDRKEPCSFPTVYLYFETTRQLVETW